MKAIQLDRNFLEAWGYLAQVWLGVRSFVHSWHLFDAVSYSLNGQLIFSMNAAFYGLDGQAQIIALAAISSLMAVILLTACNYLWFIRSSTIENCGKMGA